MKKCWIALALGAVVAVGCGGLESEALESSEQAVVVAATEEVCATPVEDADRADGKARADADADVACANGYCCNQDTGIVSKTSQSGCNGANDVWHATLRACLGDRVCGSPSNACRIN